MDALTHAIEAYIGNSTTKKTREYALKATKLIFENIYKVYEDGNDLEARSNMLDAAYYAGHAFTVSYVGYVHAVAHSLGGKYNIAHGLANATLLDAVLKQYGEVCIRNSMKWLCIVASVMRRILIRLVLSVFIKQITLMKKHFGISSTFSELKKSDIHELAVYADHEANPLYPVPVLWSVKELEKVYDLVVED